MIPDSFTTVGVRIDLLIVGWVGVALILLGIACFVIDLIFDWDELGIVAGGLCVLLGVIAGIVWLILMVPFDGRYQHIYRVEGNVESVSNVLTDSSGDLTRTPVVKLDSVDRSLTIDDPRAVNLKGADVRLTCRISWHYQAADRYSCDIYSVKAQS